jgi:hypothetical protein
MWLYQKLMGTVSMDFVEIWKISGFTTVLTVIVSAFAGASFSAHYAKKKEERTRGEILKYQALRVALALERFSILCADTISDLDSYEESNGQCGGYKGMPTLSLPVDTEWKYFTQATTNKVLSFENVISHAASTIAFELSIISQHQESTEPEAQAGLCGFMAHTMAVELRDAYDLGAKEEPVHGWDYVEMLKKYHDTRKAAYDEHRLASNRNIS